MEREKFNCPLMDLKWSNLTLKRITLSRLYLLSERYMEENV